MKMCLEPNLKNNNMIRSFYQNTIYNFLNSSNDEILGILASNNLFSLEQSQRDAWLSEIDILKKVLLQYKGHIYFEYTIPRMGQRIDVLLIIESVIFVLEFKIGASRYHPSAIDQVTDYALDLKNFHETSHDKYIIPILIATAAIDTISFVEFTQQEDKLFQTLKANPNLLNEVIGKTLQLVEKEKINIGLWEAGKYQPTPTIIEAAMALYNHHSVEDLARTDASAINLTETSDAISEIITRSKANSRKSICFVTGVPGAGKTLVGLNIATKHIDKKSSLYSVFLSGNGPLVAILREALTRDKVKREKDSGKKVTKKHIFSEVKLFIQNVHNFRDEYLTDEGAPNEHVTLFDEAQRAWNSTQTINFMRRRKGKEFKISEPEFLISCMDRHKDWAVIVCLVGGGQEINTGEAGISEWLNSLQRSYPKWDVYISPQLNDSEYATSEVLQKIEAARKVNYDPKLHLSVSMRSFRAENVSLLIKQILDLEIEQAKTTLNNIHKKYPIIITRDIKKAKEWLRK